jgi:hypothetical protein
VVAAFVPYAAAVWATRDASLKVALGGIVVLHGLLLAAPLTQSQDLYMYLFYGKVWSVHGANPYLVAPAAFAADPWFAWVRWPTQPTVYGPIWTTITSIPVRLSPTSLTTAFFMTKALVMALVAAGVAGLIAASRSRGLRPGPVLVLAAWNPVILVSLPLAGHADVALVAALLWAMVADTRGHPLVATTLLAGAALVKPYALLALVVYFVALGRRDRRLLVPAAAIAAALAAITFAPFWGGLETFRGMADIAGRASASLAGEIQRVLDGILGAGPAASVVRVVGLGVVAAVLTRQALRPRFPTDPWPATSAVLVAYVLVTPWFLYWHLAGPLALAAVAASPAVRAAAFTFSGTSMVTASFGGTWWGRMLQVVLRYGPPLVVARMTARRGSRFPEESFTLDSGTGNGG